MRPSQHRRTLATMAKEYGFVLHRAHRHLVWKHPSGSIVVTSGTPSDHHALLNDRARFRRAIRSQA